MTKRKSQMTGEFNPPKRLQDRVTRSTGEETDLQPVDRNQFKTSDSENPNSQNAPRSEELNECQALCQASQSNQKTELSVMEEKAGGENLSSLSDVPPVMEQTAPVTVETTDPKNSISCALSGTLDLEISNLCQSAAKLEDIYSETTTIQESVRSQVIQNIPDCDSDLPTDECQTEREWSHEMSEKSAVIEPEKDEQLAYSDVVSETLVDQTSIDDGAGLQVTEEVEFAEPLIKRRKRRRMGMCWLGERRRSQFKVQCIRRNVVGIGQIEAGISGQGSDEDSDMKSNSLKKEISPKMEGTDPGLLYPPLITSCSLEEQLHPVVQSELEVQDQILMESMSSNLNSTESANAAKADNLNPLEMKDENEMFSNISEVKPLLNLEMCDEHVVSAKDLHDVLTVIGTEESKGYYEDCIDVEGASEVAKTFEESLVSGGSEMEVEESCPHECELRTSITLPDAAHHEEEGGLKLSKNDTEQCVEHMVTVADETISVLSVTNEKAAKCEALDFSMDTANVNDENAAACEDIGKRIGLSVPAAPPNGEAEDMQSVTGQNNSLSDTHGFHLSPGPPSPSSIHSVTDSQLNNITLSLELQDAINPEISCDLEDATELVCGLIRDLSALNHTVMDAHRKIGFIQHHPFRSPYGPCQSEI